MVASIRIEITADAARAQRVAAQTASEYDKFGDAMGDLAVPAGVAVAAIGMFGKAAIDAASNTEQAMGALESVFGSSADKVKAWAAGAAESVGLSESAYGQLASVAGASLKSMGLSADDAADQTGQLITLGADLAATFGGTTEQAVQALTSALRGEADPAERLGLKLNQTTVAARLAAKGQDKLTGSALDAAKAAAIMELATEQAAGANGQFARESDTAAGSAQIAAAQYENAKAVLGEQLLPVMVAVTTALASFAQWVGENSTLVLTLGGIIGGLAAAILAVNAAMAVAETVQAAWAAVQGVGAAATKVATAAQWLWNAALSANPVMLVVLAVAALVAGIVLLWNHSEGFRNFILGMWEAIAGAATACWDAISSAAGAAWDWVADKAQGFADFLSGVWEAIKAVAAEAWEFIKHAAFGPIGLIVYALEKFGVDTGAIFDKIKEVAVNCWEAIKSAVDSLLTPFRAVKDAVQWLIDKLKQAWDWAGKVISKIPFVSGMMGASTVAAPPVAAAVPLTSARAAPAAGGVTINVTGALDPVAVSRQIAKLLRDQNRRTTSVRV